MNINKDFDVESDNNNIIFPPLMQTLEVYIDSASDDKVNGVIQKVDKKKRKAGKKIKKKIVKIPDIVNQQNSITNTVITNNDTTTHSPLPLDAFIRPETRVSNSRDGFASISSPRHKLVIDRGGDHPSLHTIQSQHHSWASNSIEISDESSESKVLADSYLYNNQPAQTYISSPPVMDSNTAIQSFPSPHRHVIIPSNNNNNITNNRQKANLATHSSHSPIGNHTMNTSNLTPSPIKNNNNTQNSTIIQLQKTDLDFGKAVQSLAAIKLHNYAMKRRNHVTQKLKVSTIYTYNKSLYLYHLATSSYKRIYLYKYIKKLLKEIRGFHRENEYEITVAKKLRKDEILAAWKIRYYVEYLRLNSMRYVI